MRVAAVSAMDAASKCVVFLVLGVVGALEMTSVTNMMVRQVAFELNLVDNLMSDVRKVAGPSHRHALTVQLPRYRRWADRIFQRSGQVLSALTAFQVRLIAQRNGPQGALIDKTLSRIEEKSYQLKTMLIQLEQDKTTPVSYFPPELMRNSNYRPQNPYGYYGQRNNQYNIYRPSLQPVNYRRS